MPAPTISPRPPFAPPVAPLSRWTPQLAAEMRALLEGGARPRDIARALGVRAEAVHAAAVLLDSIAPAEEDADPALVERPVPAIVLLAPSECRWPVSGDVRAATDQRAWLCRLCLGGAEYCNDRCRERNRHERKEALVENASIPPMAIAPPAAPASRPSNLVPSHVWPRMCNWSSAMYFRKLFRGSRRNIREEQA